jgi:hypothetical protein
LPQGNGRFIGSHFPLQVVCGRLYWAWWSTEAVAAVCFSVRAFRFGRSAAIAFFPHVRMAVFWFADSSGRRSGDAAPMACETAQVGAARGRETNRSRNSYIAMLPQNLLIHSSSYQCRHRCTIKYQ